MTNTILLIIVIAVVTALLRFLPFWIFGEHRQTPPFIVYSCQLLPFAIL